MVVVRVATTRGRFPWCLRDPVAVVGAVMASCMSHGTLPARGRRRSRIKDDLTPVSTSTMTGVPDDGLRPSKTVWS
ncbi:hypothetical protein DEO72_LG3g2057 [Vigna unguiculata]|uniref:Uncharacterized protein n=1 Tax=Vigna unguiculata TaxID=3917 RepID=A0A4D6LFZ4_VIGUN|nr:hypothetical protein DEO72_LG3g2057 [Vigna unguiculata]